MKSAKTFYYVHNVRYSDTTHCFIRGLGIHEQMKKGFISHGGQGYPWLFMYFHTPVTLTPDTREEEKFDHGFILWDPEKFHVYGNAEKDWDHSWMILYHPEMERILQDFEIRNGSGRSNNIFPCIWKIRCSFRNWRSGFICPLHISSPSSSAIITVRPCIISWKRE